MLKLVLLSALTVSAVLVLGSFDQSDALSPMQRHMIDLADSSSDLAVKVKFGCWRVEGKLVCGKKPSKPKEESPQPTPVEEKCPADMVGKPPNCECPDGTFLVAFKGCVPVIPTAPAPSAPPSGGAKPYCITCGGPGCLQKAPACPSGGLTTCTDVPGKTYYNCCCP